MTTAEQSFDFDESSGWRNRVAVVSPAGRLGRAAGFARRKNPRTFEALKKSFHINGIAASKKIFGRWHSSLDSAKTQTKSVLAMGGYFWCLTVAPHRVLS
jgi:hypothetical protein